MIRLLVYGYATGVRSSRAIERRPADDVALRSIASFRRRHLDAFAVLFTQSLHLATKLGTVKMGRVAPDCTKLEANTSKRKAMSYGHLVDKEERIEAKVAAWKRRPTALPADAETVDEAEDETFSVDGQEADLPAELDRREKHLAKHRPPAHRSRPRPPTGRDRVPNVPAPQVLATGPIAVCLADATRLGSARLLAGLARLELGDADLLQHRLELGAVRPLAWRDN